MRESMSASPIRCRGADTGRLNARARESCAKKILEGAIKPQMSRISNLDYLKRLLTGTLAPTDESPFNFPFPIMKTLGFKLVEVSEGSASV